jgi:hypothetical protein
MQKMTALKVSLVDDLQNPKSSQEPDVKVVEILKTVLTVKYFRLLVLGGVMVSACPTLHVSLLMNYF